MRKRSFVHNYLSNEDPIYKNCLNNNGTITSCEDPDKLPERETSSSAVFTSCVFHRLISDSNGGAIYFNFNGKLTITSSAFSECAANVDPVRYYGGGAVCVESGSFAAQSNLFFSCTSGYFAGGVLAQKDCFSSHVSSCIFIRCSASYAGGLMT